MPKSEGFTPERWERELNSEELLSGLEATINFSGESGREAGFEVNYDREADSLVYPSTIYAGTETSTFVDDAIGMKEAIQRFTEETGFPVPSMRNQEYMQLPADEKVKRLVEFGVWMEDYEANIKNRMRIDYPLIQGLEKAAQLEGKESEEVLPESPEDIPRLYNTITVHTHPNRKLISPSKNDLKALNIWRMDNYTEGIKLNPVEIIAGIRKSEYKEVPGSPIGFPILAIQERPETPLDASTDWKKMSSGFYQFFTNPIVQMFGICPKGSLEEQTIRNYKLVEGIFVPEEKRIIPATRGGFSSFS